MEDEGETPIESGDKGSNVKNYLDYSRGGLGNIPSYKQKYDEYLADLKYIAKKGVAPQNYNLEKDLAKMNSNEKIFVGEKSKVKK